MSELLKGIMEEIIGYCKQQQTRLEQTELLLIIDDKVKIRIKDAFQAASRIEELIATKKAHSSVIVFDKKEEHPVVGIRFGDDGVWHLEKLNG